MKFEMIQNSKKVTKKQIIFVMQEFHRFTTVRGDQSKIKMTPIKFH